MALLARGLVPLLVLALWAYAVFDVIATDESRMNHLPKFPWLLIVLLFPPIGPIAWLVLGRPYGTSWRPGGPPRGPWVPPEDRPRYRLPSEDVPPLESREEALRRYYEEKRRRDDELRRLEEELTLGEPATEDVPPAELTDGESDPSDDEEDPRDE